MNPGELTCESCTSSTMMDHSLASIQQVYATIAENYFIGILERTLFTIGIKIKLQRLTAPIPAIRAIRLVDTMLYFNINHNH
jgi:hypothetical protein